MVGNSVVMLVAVSCFCDVHPPVYMGVCSKPCQPSGEGVGINWFTLHHLLRDVICVTKWGLLSWLKSVGLTVLRYQLEGG